MEPFRRDRLTWLAYGMLAWFAYLQAAPGLIVAHLRDELQLSYATGGLHVAAWAAGSVIAGLVTARVERALGRRAVFWLAPVGMAAGLVVLTLGRVAPVTIGALLLMGVCGGALLITIQATLADRHGERRAIALTEANVAASVAYVVLIGALSLAAATGRAGASRCWPRWSSCPSCSPATAARRSTRPPRRRATPRPRRCRRRSGSPPR